MPSLCLGQRDALSSRHGADPLALGVGKYGPSDLEDLLIAPGQLPIAHPADSRTGRFVDDLELPGALAFVAGLALGDALWTLGAAQVAHHLRVAEYLLKEGKVPLPHGSTRTMRRSDPALSPTGRSLCLVPRILGPASTPSTEMKLGSVVGRPAYEMAYRSIDGQPEPTHA